MKRNDYKHHYKPKKLVTPQAAIYRVSGEAVTIAQISERTGKHDKFIRRKFLALQRGEIDGPATWEMFA